jgi:Icc-related predicted phosphoesterase
VIRIAAVADLHAGVDSVGALAPGFVGIEERADVLLVAGDLTRYGTVEEAHVLAGELREVRLPKIAVLGNHDHHDGRPEAVVDVLGAAGIRVLEGHGLTLDVDGQRLGVAGIKGFGGGFAGACATAFGEPEMKAFVAHTQAVAQRLAVSLDELDEDGCDARVALLHYSPVPETLVGERLEIYPFLGSQLLAEAIDRSGADVALHGHAHGGTEHGCTPGGVPVRNVALPVIGCAYRIYTLGEARRPSPVTHDAAPSGPRSSR